VAIFPLFKKTPFFTEEERKLIVEAIRNAELRTSGEVRIYVESHNPFVEVMDRAAEVFYQLKMQKTEHRNAVLLYIAMKHKELALYGDEGIYKAVGQQYWSNAVQQMLQNFKGSAICDGIIQCVKTIGETLQEKFPYDAGTDKNELPDDIVFGK